MIFSGSRITTDYFGIKARYGFVNEMRRRNFEELIHNLNLYFMKLKKINVKKIGLGIVICLLLPILPIKLNAGDQVVCNYSSGVYCCYLISWGHPNSYGECVNGGLSCSVTIPLWCDNQQ
jgi:hypothetical protein